MRDGYRGLEACKSITWCPKKKTTSSTSDKSVEEDFFRLGMEWNKNNTELSKIKRSKNTQVATVVSQRANDLKVHSFGSVYGRSHDGESLAMTQPKENKTQKTSIRLFLLIPRPLRKITNKPLPRKRYPLACHLQVSPLCRYMYNLKMKKQ